MPTVRIFVLGDCLHPPTRGVLEDFAKSLNAWDNVSDLNIVVGVPVEVLELSVDIGFKQRACVVGTAEDSVVIPIDPEMTADEVMDAVRQVVSPTAAPSEEVSA